MALVSLFQLGLISGVQKPNRALHDSNLAERGDSEPIGDFRMCKL